ncbi:MAG: hypothetical protein KDJ52_12855 [Anaerolineae bacterium]|nr:hypothetical protein [Anaerolineae bacterium]
MLNSRQSKKLVLLILLLLPFFTMAASPYKAHFPNQPRISPEQAIAVAVGGWSDTPNGLVKQYTAKASKNDRQKVKIASQPLIRRERKGFSQAWDFYRAKIDALADPVMRDEADKPTLETATYPMIIQAEVEENNFRISDMGGDGNKDFGAFYPSVTYNSTDNEYLVVWIGDDNVDPLVDNEYEIFGQRLDGTTGAQKGENDFRISEMEPYNSNVPKGILPAVDVAYNSTDNTYLVVWWGNGINSPSAINEVEIFGQQLNSAGEQIGKDDFRISDMGPDGDDLFGAIFPAVVYNSTDNEYLVVWHGSDNTGDLVDDELEVFGQRLDGTTADEKESDFRISNMGPDGDGLFGALDAAVAYNSINKEYLVVWWGNDDTKTSSDEELEIFGQRLDGATGAEKGSDFRISETGPDGDTRYRVAFPDIAYNSVSNEYLVVWGGDNNAGLLVLNELEIFGQRLNGATGAEKGSDFRISEMGLDGKPAYDGNHPSVAYDHNSNEYLVVWHGNDDTIGEAEIYGQRLNPSGEQVGDDDFRISYMGTDGDANYDALYPVIAYNGVSEQFIVAWYGDDNTDMLINQEFEIFGQILLPGQQSSNPEEAVFLPIMIKSN